MRTLLILIALTFSFMNQAIAQVITSRVVDSITHESIPYATILFKNRGFISNEEGRFSFTYGTNDQPTDTLKISCLGYALIAKPLNQYKDSVIYLSPKNIELKEVVLTGADYSPDEIIEKVITNLSKNYNYDLTKKRLFFRESNHQQFSKTYYELNKSTIKEFNKKFLDSVISIVPKESSYYVEVLADLYGDYSKEKQKIKLIKASEMYDKMNETGLNALEDKFNEIIKKNVKPDSYFKIKSGWFGQKMQMEDFIEQEIDSTDEEAFKKYLEDKKNSETNRKKHFASYKKNRLVGLMGGLFFQDKTKMNVLDKPNRYVFTIEEVTFLGDEPVYVVTFEPKGNEDYKGKIYVGVYDFAVLRLDYQNVKPLKNFKLLGLSFNVFSSKGKMIFTKGGDQRYTLRYLETENGSHFGIRRPLKIVEKNKKVKGRRKQNELSVELDMAMTGYNKNEVVVFDTQAITNGDFEHVKEDNQTLPTYLPAYDPEFWKGYNIMEPNQAIKDFTVLEQSSEKLD